jgi:CubicO group peptidase (beta-lactamase class C family)
MPTILKILGWRFFFYANEGNEPIHIHCQKGDSEAKYWIDEERFEVIEAHVGEPVDEYAARELFAPLGISDHAWQYLNPDVVYTSGELALKPRDLAKFGYLYLNDGMWNGSQVLAREWVTESVTAHASSRGLAVDGEGYGYQWFTTTYLREGRPVEAVQRTGWGGQAVVLFPELDTMIVLTGGDYTLDTRFDDLITNYILPAIV